jgi:methylated-DNA-[protein]-cysteine S-methyltransferase
MIRPNYSSVIDSPIGALGIVITDNKLTRIDFSVKATKTHRTESSKLLQEIITQLNQYFKNPQYRFNLPMQINGTDFQKKVWHAMQKIPLGKAESYGEVAKKLNTGPRAIGAACRTNPIPIIIPCHRIVAANHLGGFNGKTSGVAMQIKKWLLAHEGYLS